MCGAFSSRWRAKSRHANSCNPDVSIRTDYNQFFVNMTMAAQATAAMSPHVR